MPRGSLEIAQPAHVPESVVKSYNRSVHAQDRAVWRAMMGREPVRPQACWEPRDFEGSVYYRELLQPLKVRHVVVLPVDAPILEGYPGAVYVGRTEEEGDFKPSEIEHLLAAVRQFDERTESARESRRDAVANAESPMHSRPPVSIVVVDQHLKPKLVGAEWAGFDDRLQQQMVDHARRRVQHLNGDGQSADRLLLPDAHADIWPFRVVTYRSYPAHVQRLGRRKTRGLPGRPGIVTPDSDHQIHAAGVPARADACGDRQAGGSEPFPLSSPVYRAARSNTETIHAGMSGP